MSSTGFEADAIADLNPVGGVIDMPGAGIAYSPGRSIQAECSVAGNVKFTFRDGTTRIVPLTVGLNVFSYAVVMWSYSSVPSPATATYCNLLGILRVSQVGAGGSSGGGGGGSLSDTLWTDNSGAFYVRVDTGTGVSYVTPAGVPATPGAGLRPAGDAVAVDRTGYQAVAAGTGYAVGDLIDNVIIVDRKTSTISSNLWVNLTSGAVIAPPSAVNLKPYAAGNTGSTGLDHSINKPALPVLGANFGGSGPYANYVLVQTVAANPSRANLDVENNSISPIAVVRDDGTAVAAAALANASVFGLEPAAAAGRQGGSWTSSTFRGRLQVFAPTGAAPQLSIFED